MAEPLQIVKYPDPILRHPTEPVGEVDEDLRVLIPAMLETMNEARGLGLAANQVGINRRFALVSDTGDEAETRVVIDPEITGSDGALAMEEGCLSFPGLTGLITRPERVTVRYTNLDGETVEEEVDGLLSRCFQHEIDHLDGILFISKMTPADRVRLKRDIRELESEYANR
jgi:peptide deformylase